MTSTRNGAGLPVALLVSVLMLFGIAVVGVAAGPDVALGRPAPQAPADPAPDGSVHAVVLRDALGDPFEIRDGEVVADAVESFPVELSAHGYVSVIPAAASSFRCPPEDAPDACRQVTVSGRPVDVVSTGALHSATGSNFGSLTVRYLRPDGHLAVVALSVLGKPEGGSSSALEEQIHDWLDSQESALIAAATDDRLAPAA